MRQTFLNAVLTVKRKINAYLSGAPWPLNLREYFVVTKSSVFKIPGLCIGSWRGLFQPREVFSCYGESCSGGNNEGG